MGIKGIDQWVVVAGDLQGRLDFYQRLAFSIAWKTTCGPRHAHDPYQRDAEDQRPPT